MNPSQVYQLLLRAETDGDNAPDMRRVLSTERQVLHVALASKDPKRIATAAAEGLRVARMWGVE